MISVIIPFYNVEKYIEKCIFSVKNQTFTNFECILIDDASLDTSFKIAKKVIESDTRFRIIQQKNKGLGGARNTGIEHAKGEFIAFLDSDDYWEPTFLEVMHQAITQQNADISICYHKRVNEKGEILKKSLFFGDLNHIENFLFSNHITWDKLYRTTLFEKIRFPEKRYFEDFATIYKLAPLVTKIAFVKEPLINYLVREGSITEQPISKKHIEDYFITFKEINQFYGYEKISKFEGYFRLLHRFSLFKNNKKLLHESHKNVKQKINELHISFSDILNEKNDLNFFRLWLFTFLPFSVWIKLYNFIPKLYNFILKLYNFYLKIKK